MTLEDETDGAERLRRAFSVTASALGGGGSGRCPPGRGMPGSGTRTAISTSLAFSLVIFAGLGSVYVAAHRSRPSSLGSDNAQATPTVLDSASPTPGTTPLFAGFLTEPVVAGKADLLHLSGEPGSGLHYVIVWGDGTTDSAGSGSRRHLRAVSRRSEHGRRLPTPMPPAAS